MEVWFHFFLSLDRKDQYLKRTSYNGSLNAKGIKGLKSNGLETIVESLVEVYIH